MSTPCPEPARWQALIEGSLPESDQTELGLHLEQCLRCQGAMDVLAAGTRSWSMLAGREEEGRTSVESALGQAIASLKNEAWQPPQARWNDNEQDTPLDFLDPPTHAEHLGRLGPYDVLDVIGQGGMGVVLKAHHAPTRRLVALKVLAPALAMNGTAVRRFSQEGRIAASLDHPHIVNLYAVEGIAGVHFLVLEYVPGDSLQARLDREGPLPLRSILQVAVQVAEGLAHAHEQGIIHRDVKPSNILLGLTPAGVGANDQEPDAEPTFHDSPAGPLCVKLTDFGLARAMDDIRLTQSGVVPGTPAYMAPEQARGEEVDARADLFSLGSVMYAMCTGRGPFRARNVPAVLKRVCDETPRPIGTLNPAIPQGLIQVIERLHAKDADERFQTAAEVAQVLRQQLAQLGRGESLRAPVAQKPRRVLGLVPALLVGLVCLLMPGGFVAWRVLPLLLPAHPEEPLEKPSVAGEQPDTPRPAAVEAADEKPAKAGQPARTPLRYGWKQNEAYVYSVRIEVEHPETRELFSGSAVYRVKAVDPAGMTLTVHGGLAAFHQQAAGAGLRAPIGLIGRPTFLAQASVDFNELRIDPHGQVLRVRSQGQLPLALGSLLQLAFDRLNEKGQAEWTWQANRRVVIEPERDPLDGILPQGFGPRFGPNFRMRSEPQPRVEFEIRERFTYTLGPLQDGLREVKKRLELQTLEQSGPEPRWHLTAQGELLFDETLGVPRSFAWSGEQVERRGVQTLREPVHFVYKLLEGEERERVLNPPPVQPAEPQPIAAEEVQKALAALTAEDMIVRREAAKTLGRARPDARRAEVARALERLVHDQDHFSRLHGIDALGVWGDAAAVPVLIDALDAENIFVRKALLAALGKLRDPRAIPVIGKSLFDVHARGTASQALQNIGPRAEASVLPLLRHTDVFLRIEACTILSAIGAEASVLPLEEATRDGNGLVALSAKDAFKSVRERLALRPFQPW